MTQAARQRTLWFCVSLFAGVMMLPANMADAAEAEAAANAPKFETHIAAIFKKHCVRCHNPQAMKAELDLSTPQGLFQGGESGLALTPGKLDESLLWEYVHSGAMPPEDEGQLSKNEIEVIGQWIVAGTPFEKLDLKTLLAASEVNNHQIEPLMLLRCTVCHGLRTQEAGLDLRTKASMLKGGKSGPAIVLGKPDESLVIKKIRGGQMPPKDRLIRAGVRPVQSGELEKLARWIELGAPEIHIVPDVATTSPDPLVSDEDRQHWAFQTPARPSPPTVKHQDRVRNAIDAFILRKLESQGLSFSAEADKTILIRRAYYDLTGLPPEPSEVEAFAADKDPQAYERMIDQLLASPRYGEKWGRQWLDLAGYADSEGKRSADPIRPFAWKYRDYVIRAFNADKPYDQFLTEQLAGDELFDHENTKDLTAEMLEKLVATGFLRMAPDGTGSDVVNRVPERLEVVSDEIDIFSSVVLGMTIKCGRCHSHKYDPIPQRDYYRLAAIFKGGLDEHDWLKPAFVPGQSKSKRPGRYLAYATAEEKVAQEKFNKELDAKIVIEKSKLDDLVTKLRQKHLEAGLPKIPEVLHDDLRKTFDTPANKRNEVQKYLATKFEKTLWLSKKQVNNSTEYKAESRNVKLAVRALEGQKQKEAQIRALWDRGEPSPTYIYRRGDHLQPSRLVGPGVPSVLTDGKTPFVVTKPFPKAKSTGRRLALARWLVAPDHPLTARVMVNRIWDGHFGEGIVRSTGDFGKLGTPPTHPELLDWLARRFIDQGWSIKAMHRLMVTSSTYRQVSDVAPELEKLDGENKLLSRIPLRRLTAEEVRDSLLLVSGRLDETRFGRPDAVKVRKDGLVTSVPGEDGWRRSIYIQHRRKSIPTALEVFDQPQMNPNCLQRPNSTVAHQALYLMNNAMVHDLSENFAERISGQSENPDQQIEAIYLTALSRRPDTEELRASRTAYDALKAQWMMEFGEKKRHETKAAQKALASLCHTIINSAAFVYVD